MLVRKWMSLNPRTIQVTEPVAEAMKLMKEGSIRHLPVMDGDRLVGIVTDRDIKEFSPSKATTLDMYELHYLLSKATVAEAMKKDPLRLHPDDTIERAALLMHDNKIGCLPVVDDNGKVAGMLTQEDVFEALITVLGCRSDTVRLQMSIPDEPGSIKVVTDKVRSYGLNIRSIFSTYVNVAPGTRELILRVSGETLALERELKQEYPDLFVHRGV